LDNQPPETLHELGRIFQLDDREQAFFELAQLKAESLDGSYLNVFSINHQAPLRGILEDVEALAKAAHPDTGQPRTRRRTDVLDDYLHAWDLREGWTGNCYDAAQEHRLRDVAARLQSPLPTIQARYRESFRLITGRDYDRDLWFSLFGELKVSRWANWRTRKPRLESGRRPRLVSETQRRETGNEEQSVSPVEGALSSDDSKFFTELRLDVDALVARGRTNEQIAIELECDVELVSWLREHHEDPVVMTSL
jgi:hypothetical protein